MERFRQFAAHAHGGVVRRQTFRRAPEIQQRIADAALRGSVIGAQRERALEARERFGRTLQVAQNVAARHEGFRVIAARAKRLVV
jgi:hypothetical protein